MGSQLLSDRTAISGYKHSVPEPAAAKEFGTAGETGISYSTSGALATLAIAFSAVGALDWARPGRNNQGLSWRLAIVLALIGIGMIHFYVVFKRQYTRHLRRATLDAASTLVAHAQCFDGAAAAASTLIQEVEIVSRGYRISSPLPPASRLDDTQLELRRCARLRRALRSTLDSLIAPHAEAFVSLRPLVVESDMDQYLDIYELSRTDVMEAEEALHSAAVESFDDESLKAIRVRLHKLHIVRKLYLCSILALDVGTQLDVPGWTSITETLHTLSEKSAAAAGALDKVLSEEQQFPLPKTPKHSTTQQHQRLQAQARKFTVLSQGLRGLQAKMHILREESDRTLNSSEEVAGLGSSLLEQYDAIGADLKSLTQDWEEGRAALTANIDKHERRVSQISSGSLFSSPSTPVSMGGLTAVNESPSAALRILNGEGASPADARSSDEEVFEALAAPRPRSTLTREERIARMKEERVRQAEAREKGDASRFMLKELETVIKMRPRARSSARMSTP